MNLLLFPKQSRASGNHSVTGGCAVRGKGEEPQQNFHPVPLPEGLPAYPLFSAFFLCYHKKAELII
jgi:hypothetical protein